jgi:glycosyltransferase involved in cell wall biosynthesis
LRAALVQIAGDGALRERMSHAARALSAERFSWYEHVDALEHHYRSAVKEAR